MQSLMAGQIFAELVDMVALAERVIAGEEIEVVESFEYENADIMVLFSNLKEFILTVEGSGDDMLVTLRSANVPELNIGLPRPVYINLGKPLVVEDYC